MDELDDDEEERMHRKKTVDLGDLYNNINLQLGHRQRQYHSDSFNDRVEAYEQAMEQDQQFDEEVAKKVELEENAKKIMAQGMTPDVMPEIRHPNTSINLSEMYGGMNGGD